jgi:Low molecular weight phosphotyrosine protein phosphatase
VKDVPEVLFVCVHNAGRSQMAAGLLDKVAAGRVHVRTAGSDPADQINPAVVEAMTEVGVDLSQEFPRAAHGRVRPGGRRRDHDGLWRRLPDLPRHALCRAWAVKEAHQGPGGSAADRVDAGLLALLGVEIARSHRQAGGRAGLVGPERGTPGEVR